MRELTSKIQTMRKEAGFEVMDRITVYADGNDRITAILKRYSDQISNDVLASRIVTGSIHGYEKTWNVNGENVTLGVEKVEE